MIKCGIDLLMFFLSFNKLGSDYHEKMVGVRREGGKENKRIIIISDQAST